MIYDAKSINTFMRLFPAFLNKFCHMKLKGKFTDVIVLQVINFYFIYINIYIYIYIFTWNHITECKQMTIMK